MTEVDRDIRLQGQLIDDQILSRVLDLVARYGARYEICSLRIGRTGAEPSEAVLTLTAPDRPTLERVLRAVADFGAEPLGPSPATLAPAPADGVLPEGFYATSNLPTEVLSGEGWLPVAGEEMDLAVVVSADGTSARAVPMAGVRRGELVVTGDEGVRVRPAARGEGVGGFRFMASEVSAEKPKGPLLARVIEALRGVRARGEKILLVAGPAVVHTGAGPVVEGLIREGWIDLLFAGNALAAHDVEAALYGTSLGVPIAGGESSPGGHAHHLWAINAIRKAGSLGAAVRSGLLKGGIMHASVLRGIPFVLAGSIRDDGPLPDVITDVMAAQQAMRALVPGVGAALLIGTTLHAVATGNLLPARVLTICVDINPAVVTKLQDRGSRQSLGIVMDGASFLEQLSRGLIG